jgi:hypothetical protein
MAFIRSYMARSRMIAGDPFLGIKLPKIKVAKILGNVAKAAVGSAVPIAGKAISAVQALTKKTGPIGPMGLPMNYWLHPSSMLGPAQPGTGASGPTITVTPQGQAMIDETRRSLGLGKRRYRRMNVTNMRALTRAVRRVKKFEKIARQCVTVSHHVRVKKGSRGRKC